MIWKDTVQEHYANNGVYTQRDFVEHFSDREALDGLKHFMRTQGHRPMLTFSGTSNDFQALVAPSLQSVITEYGFLGDLPENLITSIPEDRDHTKKRFVHKAEGIKDYLEGQPFEETYFEASSALVRWRKPGAKIANSYEAIKDIPLDVLQINMRLTINEFKAREWKHFAHELHKSTSNEFNMNATDRHGNDLQAGTGDNAVLGWRHLFSNATDASGTDFVTWDDIKIGRRTMAARERDAVMPDTVILNASTEAELGDDTRVTNAHIWGNAGTYFQTGKLPSVYGITNWVVVPDSNWGFFVDDVTRDAFSLTNDVILLTTQNGPTIMRHTREPLSTETWRIFDGQKECVNLWERYDYSVFRYTNLLRIASLNGSEAFIT